MAAHPGPGGRKRWRPPPFHRFRQVAADVWLADRPIAAVMAVAEDDARRGNQQAQCLYAAWRKRAHPAPASFAAFNTVLRRLTQCPEIDPDPVALGDLPRRAWGKKKKAGEKNHRHPDVKRPPPGIPEPVKAPESSEDKAGSTGSIAASTAGSTAGSAAGAAEPPRPVPLWARYTGPGPVGPEKVEFTYTGPGPVGTFAYTPIVIDIDIDSSPRSAAQK